ncbi:hypothetical protein N7466_000625 [Penicillium verhagenii]|uniref:uncharacterized protein n=1 Tax=Penicillium verhagenii TaxID=1562060 RepID=UPI0025456BCF|nr:uncharacterized protein N7466_000625 [Penicillium verhagenii]KAJ5947610.1 hypothetical protein N7466_000625 [Penicillium verhagenii]
MISRRVLILHHRLGDSPQMSHQDPKRKDDQARQDEARLLGGKFKDANAVKIKPGATLQGRKKNPGSNAAFRPHNRISHNARESGPVPARGKTKQTVPINKLPHLEDAFEPSSRPIKRRRQDPIGDGFDNQGVNNPLSPPKKTRASPELGEISPKPKKNALPIRHNGTSHSEDGVGSAPNRQLALSSPDERFTAQATQQRRSKSGASEPLAKSGKAKPARSILDSIDIPIPKKGKMAARIQSIQSSSVKRNGIIPSSGSESSDELQGEVTTQPAPRKLNDRQNQTRLSFDRSSPTDIVPTRFAGSNRKAKIKHNISNSDPVRLSIMRLQFGTVNVKSGAKGKSAYIYLVDEKLEIGDDISGTGEHIAIPLSKVVRIHLGKDPSRKLRLNLSKGALPMGDKVDIEFSDTSNKNRLARVLKDKSVKILEQEPGFMTRAFRTREQEVAEFHKQPKRPLPDFDQTPPANPSVRRPKLSSALQDSAEEPVTKRAKRDVSSISKTGDSQAEIPVPEHKKRAGSDASVELPVKSIQEVQTPLERSSRPTRRTTRNTNNSFHDLFKGAPQPKDENRDNWKKPMVYPRSGKKRAEVSVEDRDRLREDEFLNDNLIGFYLRFLQDHLERTNEAAAKRIYFFNSFFFATLTNTAKGDQGINYSGVEKWTRNIDLFSYDYIIVPINQNAHWYVAIICNLPSLNVPPPGIVDQFLASMNDKKPSTPTDSEVQEVLESPEPELAVSAAAAGVEQEAKVNETDLEENLTETPSMKAVEEPTRADNAEDSGSKISNDEWPDGDESQASPPPKLNRLLWNQTDPIKTLSQSTAASQPSPKTKKKGRTGPKLHPSQPTIITFDSLDVPRSPTIKILREYVFKEAESKRGVDINDQMEIKGMRARQIPIQPNYSDCGLYLLAYVEKFVQNPDTFIKRVLQREMSKKDDWPPLESGLLRYRLRTFLDDMYEEQKQLEGKLVMADQERISFLLGPPLPSEEDEEKEENGEIAKTEEQEPINPFRDVGFEATGKAAKLASKATKTCAADKSQLVPTDPVPSNPSSEQDRQPVDTEPLKGIFERRSSDPGNIDRDVLGLPGSQEPKTTHDGKKKSKSEHGLTRRKEKRKATAAFPEDADAVNGSCPKTEHQKPCVEIQVKATPPPDEPVRPQKSPRQKKQKS